MSPHLLRDARLYALNLLLFKNCFVLNSYFCYIYLFELLSSFFSPPLRFVSTKLKPHYPTKSFLNPLSLVFMGERMSIQLINFEDNDDKLKLTFKTTFNKPLLLFKSKNDAAILTENYEIYEIQFNGFPEIMLRYYVKDAHTDYKETPMGEHTIFVHTLGFKNFKDFKQFILKNPIYVRYLEFLYSIFYLLPHLDLLYYGARMKYKHDIKINDNETEITIEKIRIDVIIKKFKINNKLPLKILNENGMVSLTIGDKPPFFTFGYVLPYDDFVKILKERPNAILNTLIMLIITFLDLGRD